MKYIVLYQNIKLKAGVSGRGPPQRAICRRHIAPFQSAILSLPLGVAASCTYSSLLHAGTTLCAVGSVTVMVSQSAPAPCASPDACASSAYHPASASSSALCWLLVCSQHQHCHPYHWPCVLQHVSTCLRLLVLLLHPLPAT